MSEKEEETHPVLIESWSPGDVLYYGPNSRALNLYGDVCKETTLVLISQILELDRRDSSPITIYINSDGGSLSDALAIYDCIRYIESPVITVATGVCASAAILILSAGDLRLATQHCLFFYHQAIMPGQSIGSKEHVDSLGTTYELCQTRYDDILRKRSKMSKTMFKKEFEGRTSKYFVSEEALNFKLIDGILGTKKKKSKIKLE